MQILCIKLALIKDRKCIFFNRVKATNDTSTYVKQTWRPITLFFLIYFYLVNIDWMHSNLMKYLQGIFNCQHYFWIILRLIFFNLNIFKIFVSVNSVNILTILFKTFMITSLLKWNSDPTPVSQGIYPLNTIT